MNSRPLMQAGELSAALASTDPPVVIDCSFDLTDLAAGRRSHAAAHIPGAIHVDLDQTLSGARTGLNGRHPLPSPEDFARAMADLGVDDSSKVVAYDNAGGMYAARLWWMLRWVGHADVVVLDGGLAAWKAASLPLSNEAPAARARGRFSVRPALVRTIDYAGVRTNLASQQFLVIDARAADRFRGENETLDPVGGHIPGARNRLFRHNLAPDGRFKRADQLRQEFESLTDGRPVTQLVSQCGSGVTACHNLLAMEAAGLAGAALYPGSWSEWCARPDAPVATGAD